VVFYSTRLRAYGPYLPRPPVSEWASERLENNNRTFGKITWLRVERLSGCGSIPGKYVGFFSSPKTLERPLNPHIHRGTETLSPGVKWPEDET
jgi:hypothetical protein